MGVFSKLKNIFYDEIEVEEENEVEKELESVNRVVIKDDDEPKIEKIKTRIEEELNKKAVIIDCHGTTDVEDITTPTPSLDITQPMYNVLGQQVDATYKGIIIQNGYKYIK